MLRSLKLLFDLIVQSCCSRRDLLLENLALRQQLTILKQRHPQPRFAVSDVVLGDLAPAVAGMESGIDPRPAGDRRPLASGGVQALLDVAIEASDPCGKKVREKRTAPTDLPHGRQQPQLGRAADSR